MRSSSAILHQIDPALEEASISLGVSPLRTFLGLVVPLMLGGIVSGIEGDDDPLKTGNLICGNEFVHAELVKILKPLGK